VKTQKVKTYPIIQFNTQLITFAHFKNLGNWLQSVWQLYLRRTLQLVATLLYMYLLHTVQSVQVSDTTKAQ
jgi:hypothetical protein